MHAARWIRLVFVAVSGVGRLRYVLGLFLKMARGKGGRGVSVKEELWEGMSAVASGPFWFSGGH